MPEISGQEDRHISLMGHMDMSRSQLLLGNTDIRRSCQSNSQSWTGEGQARGMSWADSDGSGKFEDIVYLAGR